MTGLGMGILIILGVVGIAGLAVGLAWRGADRKGDASGQPTHLGDDGGHGSGHDHHGGSDSGSGNGGDGGGGGD